MNRGFTLLELILVLLIVGVVGIAASVGLVPVAEAFLLVRRNADAAQKAQFAMQRITREFVTITNVASADAQTIVYDFLDQTGAPHRRTLAWSGTAGTPLQLDGSSLLDDVASFELRYLDRPDSTPSSVWRDTTREVEVVLALASTANVYTNRVRPRNVTK